MYLLRFLALMRKTLLLLLLLPVMAVAQTKKWLDEASGKTAGEKIYIHADRDAYLAGETVYFKAYIMSGLYPSTYSSSFYVQLNSDSGVLQKAVFPVIAGTAVGTIRLPSDLEEGRYFLTAYTNTSARETERIGYVMPLLVLNATSRQRAALASYEAKPSIRIHYGNSKPVGGIENQVFVSVLDQYHQPLQAEAQLLDESNTVLARFSTNAAGVGAIAFTPQQGKKYRVETTTGGRKYTTPLAPAEASGIGMNITRQNKDYLVTISATPGYAAGKMSLVAEYEYNVLLEQDVKLQNNAAKLMIRTAQMTSGVLRLVLLDEKGEALAERFVFSPNPEATVSGEAKIEGDVQGRFTLQFPEGVEGTVSVQMNDRSNSIQTPYRKENIINRFLFSSQLQEPLSFARGLVTDPAKADADLLNSILATQKIAKPSWAEIRQGLPGKKLEDDSNYIRIEGVVDAASKKGLPEEAELNVIMRTADSAQNIFMVPVDKQGRFTLAGLIFTDSASMLYQLNSAKFRGKRANVDITAHSLSDPMTGVENQWNFREYFLPVGGVPAGHPGQLVQKAYTPVGDNGSMLSEVVVSTVRTWREVKAESEERYFTGVFKTQGTRIMNFISDPHPNGWLWDYLGRFTNQRFIVMPDKIIMQVSIRYVVEYQYFLNEAPTTVDMLQRLRLDDLAMVKVWAGGFLGAESRKPAIAVYTRKFEDIRNKEVEILKSIKIPGYTPARDFILPNKDTKDPGRYAFTFYWNPYLLIDTEGQKLSTPFYNINKAQPRVTVEGITSEGRLVYYEGGN
jgi:hypothetical protein